MRFVGRILNMVIFPLTKPYGGATDYQGHKIARLLLNPSSARDRLTKGIYFTDDPNDAMGRIEHALNASLDSESAERKLRDARRIGLITARDVTSAVADAIKQSIINEAEAEKILVAHAATLNAISVDEFSPKGWDPL
ncbi:hypothetical protein MNBD_GAMMA07-1525 [hydrothermal vent metagenome]|uniref:Acyl-CoA dehydrogenase C-terminal bacterial-type domain-containing protein n=1 Tax=hydrothermal vent metagenome TaxID=652676 RepID=A0A3B0WRP7_9ZZZZ